MVLQAIYIVLSIFLMVGVGMLLGQIGWIKEEHEGLISRLVVKVGLPGMIISKLFTQFSREGLIASATGVIAPFVSLLLTMGLGILVSRLGRIPKGRRGAFTCMFTFSNSVFIGLPVSVALFGEGVVPYTLLYYVANTIVFWSLGHILLSTDGDKPILQKGSVQVSKLFPLPLLVFFGCCLMVAVGVKLPSFVLDAAKHIGDLVTPMSAIYAGIIIMKMLKSGRFRWEKGYGLILMGRFLCSPLMLLFTSSFVTMPDLMRNALLIQAAMPVMTQTPIVAGECGSDAEYAAGGIAISTLCSLVSIPAYMALTAYL